MRTAYPAMATRSRIGRKGCAAGTKSSSLRTVNRLFRRTSAPRILRSQGRQVERKIVYGIGEVFQQRKVGAINQRYLVG